MPITDPRIWLDVAAERERAHAKHGATSCEGMPALDPGRLPILVEEVGEVARELNDLRHHQTAEARSRTRAELVQVAAVAVGWIAALDRDGE
jgi:hypothetical protein